MCLSCVCACVWICMRINYDNCGHVVGLLSCRVDGEERRNCFMRALFDGFSRVTDIGHQSRDYHALCCSVCSFLFPSLITFHFGREIKMCSQVGQKRIIKALQHSGSICQVGVAEVAAGSLNFGNMSSATWAASLSRPCSFYLSLYVLHNYQLILILTTLCHPT